MSKCDLKAIQEIVLFFLKTLFKKEKSKTVLFSTLNHYFFFLKPVQKTLREWLTPAPCTTFWVSTLPLTTKTTLRARRVSRPNSMPSATNWFNRWGENTYLTNKDDLKPIYLPSTRGSACFWLAVESDKTFCSEYVVYLFICGCSSNCLSFCFVCLFTGSLSHWTACSTGFDNQLPAETGREVHNFLPPQLWQARLLQGQAGENFRVWPNTIPPVEGD